MIPRRGAQAHAFARLMCCVVVVVDCDCDCDGDDDDVDDDGHCLCHMPQETRPLMWWPVVVVEVFNELLFASSAHKYINVIVRDHSAVDACLNAAHCLRSCTHVMARISISYTQYV